MFGRSVVISLAGSTSGPLKDRLEMRQHLELEPLVRQRVPLLAPMITTRPTKGGFNLTILHAKRNDTHQLQHLGVPVGGIGAERARTGVFRLDRINQGCISHSTNTPGVTH